MDVVGTKSRFEDNLDILSPAQFLLTVGGILLLGLVTSSIGHKTLLPRVTLLLLFGIFIGKEALDVIPDIFSDRFELISNVALLMVGFLLGGKLHLSSIRKSAGQILWISLSAAIVTTLVVSIGLIMLGVTAGIAVLLGCIASATAPAAILDVVTEAGTTGRFRDVLLSIVALDDAWALVLFALGVAVAGSLEGADSNTSTVVTAFWEIGGAIGLGLLLGLPAAYLTGRIRKGQPIVSEALGIVFICGGLAIWLEVSFLIAAMMMGAVITNLARHHTYPFHAIEGIESPFMVIFFVLAGASLELAALQEIGLVGTVYILSRAAGKIGGARLGSQMARADQVTKNWMGLALLPQAGVAIGMALIAANEFPDSRQMLLSVVISSTIFFEIIGPIFTRLAMRRAMGNKN